MTCYNFVFRASNLLVSTALLSDGKLLHITLQGSYLKGCPQIDLIIAHLLNQLVGWSIVVHRLGLLGYLLHTVGIGYEG